MYIPVLVFIWIVYMQYMFEYHAYVKCILTYFLIEKQSPASQKALNGNEIHPVFM